MTNGVSVKPSRIPNPPPPRATSRPDVSFPAFAHPNLSPPPPTFFRSGPKVIIGIPKLRRQTPCLPKEPGRVYRWSERPRELCCARWRLVEVLLSPNFFLGITENCFRTDAHQVAGGKFFPGWKMKISRIAGNSIFSGTTEAYSALVGIIYPTRPLDESWGSAGGGFSGWQRSRAVSGKGVRDLRPSGLENCD